MTDIASPAGMAALSALRGKRLLCAFDFDGTLSSTAARPEDAVLAPEVEEMLRTLSAHVPVAVISGRRRADVLRFFHPAPRYVIGNHGAEGLPRSYPTAPKRRTRLWVDLLREALQEDLSAGRARIEDKRLSLTVHSADPVVHDRVRALLPRLTGARIMSGIRSSNIVDRSSPGKGVVLQRILHESGCDTAIFTGNEETDEDVFLLHDPRILGVRVGPCVTTAAQFILPSQEGIEWLLRELIRVTARDGVPQW